MPSKILKKDCSWRFQIKISVLQFSNSSTSKRKHISFFTEKSLWNVHLGIELHGSSFHTSFHPSLPISITHSHTLILQFFISLSLTTPISISSRRSYNNSGTGLYDSFQTATNGIAK